MTETTRTDARGACATCGRVMHVRLDGVLRSHRNLDGVGCEGSMHPPVERALDAYRMYQAIVELKRDNRTLWRALERLDKAIEVGARKGWES